MAKAKDKRGGKGKSKSELAKRGGGDCCLSAADRVVLSMANPIDTGDALFRGFRRVHVDGSAPAGEYVDPYGYVIPKGRGLVVTDLAYYSSFTQPRPAGDISRLFLGYVHVLPNGLTQGLIFVTTPVFSPNGSIGGNVTLHTGFVIPHGRYLSVDLDDSELVATELFVYGYLIDL